jgi:hypothetical protein
VPSRRMLNRVGDQLRRERAMDRAGDDHVREQERLGALFDLEVPCACGHDLGFHRFTTPALPSPCGFAGCPCHNFVRQEDPVLNPNDPFAGMMLGEPELEPPPPQTPTGTLTGEQFVAGLDEPEPPEPMQSVGELAAEMIRGTSFGQLAERLAQNERPAQNTPWEAISGPVGAADPHPTETPVLFPVVVQGEPLVALDRLLDPAQRVADIVDALEPVLAPPLAVRQLLELVDKANALQVTDAGTYKQGCDFYEELTANARAIEDGPIGQVVAFFYRPWKAFCGFRAKYSHPVDVARKRLSDDCGAWKLAEDKRAAAQAREDSEAAAEAERLRLKEIADAATAAAAAAPAESAVREVLEQTAVQATEQAATTVAIPQPARSTAPATTTNGRKKWEAVIVDADAFYKALSEDPTRRVAAPVDLAYLTRQAGDMGEDIAKRFPGVEAREKGGLTARGRR